jgi:hypothetical protein
MMWLLASVLAVWGSAVTAGHDSASPSSPPEPGKEASIVLVSPVAFLAR